jgi:hypothetical protein
MKFIDTLASSVHQREPTTGFESTKFGDRGGSWAPSVLSMKDTGPPSRFACRWAAMACGDPKHGFAWLACPEGHHHRLVPFSWQTRTFCPSCCGRRMGYAFVLGKAHYALRGALPEPEDNEP